MVDQLFAIQPMRPHYRLVQREFRIKAQPLTMKGQAQEMGIREQQLVDAEQAHRSHGAGGFFQGLADDRIQR